MSRAAVKAKQDERLRQRRFERDADWLRRVDEYAVLDACFVACDGCGAEQVASGMPRGDWYVAPPCVVCGSVVGSFVSRVSGHHLGP